MAYFYFILKLTIYQKLNLGILIKVMFTKENTNAKISKLTRAFWIRIAPQNNVTVALGIYNAFRLFVSLEYVALITTDRTTRSEQ